MNNLEVNNNTLESIKHIDEYGMNTGLRESYKKHYNILNGENSKV